METNQKQFLYRLYLVASVLIVLGLGIGYKIFHIQYIEGKNYRELAKNNTIQNFTITPERGSIFSDDGSLLAASITSYDIYFDAVTVSNSNFLKYSGLLAENLSVVLQKDKQHYSDKLNYARQNKKRYFLIEKDVSTEILNKIAERTIGNEKNFDGTKFSGVGLEHAFGSELRGKDGTQLMQKISNGKWKPINSNNKIEPTPGQDIVTTINVGFQDITHHALLEQLEKFEADHGTAVVMETSTGEIKAISNLGRTSNGKYYERLNYAVGEHFEPGSTFKLMTLMAALEDGKVELQNFVDTEKGILSFYGSKVRDSKEGGYGKISVSDAFMFSSNTGIVKLINEAYKDNPESFSNRLYNMGLNNKLGLSILGESNPKIPHPRDRDWSGLSLPWMAYGYGVLLSPLQILSFYNAVANDGEMVKPIFRKISNSSNNKIILNPSISSQSTIKIAKSLLHDVVNKDGGTANNIRSSSYKIAGKTGTAQVDYTTENVQYISSFVGYFPADNPKYSCIVVIHKPNKSKGYYGSTVAAPVFKKISDKIHSLTPINFDLNPTKIDEVYESFQNDELIITSSDLSVIRGKSFNKVLPLLENMGYEVISRGKGILIKNYKVKSDNKVEVELV